jgi:hypothetical protein
MLCCAFLTLLATPALVWWLRLRNRWKAERSEGHPCCAGEGVRRQGRTLLMWCAIVALAGFLAAGAIHRGDPEDFARDFCSSSESKTAFGSMLPGQ